MIIGRTLNDSNEVKMKYSQENTLRLAKRYNNSKRAYLLVNPLQAKHIPVSPSQALSMMKALGNKLKEVYPFTKLVIGFAETATAIGAEVSSAFGGECIYIHTTREEIDNIGKWILFQEEHSHAVEQKLCSERLGEWIENTDTVIFVDDEISTGKTLINMIHQLKESYPDLGKKNLIAASILNRVDKENEQRLNDAGISCEYLVKLPQEDYTAQVEKFNVREAESSERMETEWKHQLLACDGLLDPRIGVGVENYLDNCKAFSESFIKIFAKQFEAKKRILVLGTEECMYPALALGRKLELCEKDFTVRCHATTRSPIGICDVEGYPIVSGIKLQSFYDSNRTTYLYDLDSYDILIVVSDTQSESMKAMESIADAFESKEFYYIRGGKDVWYL